MPRQARKTSCSKVYHCMLRGVNKQDIFFDKQDYFKFQEILKKTKTKYFYQLYSYVLMPNHIHLEIKDENQNLSTIIHNIATSYAIYFNKKYERKGHLFENRFKSKNVENAYYIVNLVRYIHQNPVKAGISEMENYKWSSYLEYFKVNNIDEKNRIVDTEEILFQFLPEKEKAQKEFLKFNKEMIRFKESTELLQYEIKNKLTDEEVIYFIKEQIGIDNIQDIQKYNKKYRNSIIKKIKNIEGITQNQISRILGITINIIKKVN